MLFGITTSIAGLSTTGVLAGRFVLYVQYHELLQLYYVYLNNMAQYIVQVYIVVGGHSVQLLIMV